MAGRSAQRSYDLDTIGAADIQEIAAIERESFSDPWSARGFTDILSFPGAYLRCARERGVRTILGYVVAWFVADEGQISNLAVRPGSKRQGVGAALLDGMLAEARVQSVRSVYLEVRMSNDGARALYRSRGFTEVGVRKGYYRSPLEDGLVLRRAIPDVPQ